MKTYLTVIFLTVLMGTSAASAQNGWISASQMKAEVAKMRANGEYLSGIACRKNGNATEFQFSKTRGFGPREREWTWAYGYSISDKNLELQKQGYRQVSRYNNHYKGKVHCAVWYKN